MGQPLVFLNSRRFFAFIALNESLIVDAMLLLEAKLEKLRFGEESKAPKELFKA